MIENALIIAMVCCFIHVCTWDEMKLARPANWLRAHAPEWITKPLFDCPVCMCPWWGVPILYFAGLGEWDWWPVILTVATAGGINMFAIIAIRKHELNTAMLDEMEMPNENSE